MTIDFNCEHCENLVRTPKAAAGKKGRCPFCQAVMQIPLASTATAPVTAVMPSPPARLPEKRVGAPPVKPVAKPIAKPNLVAKTAAIELPTQPDTIEFSCLHCSSQVRTPRSMAGKKGRCPSCKEVVQIPGGEMKSPANSKPLAPLGGMVHANGQAAGLAGVGGLTPMPVLAPMGAPAQLMPLSPLTPIAPSSPFAPMPNAQGASNPFMNAGGLMPLNKDPFGGSLASSSLTIGPALASNPYASPAALPSSSPKYRYASGEDDDLDDSRRRGLPWESSSGANEWTETITMCLSRPTEAFRNMWTTSKVGTAFGYLIAGQFSIVILQVFAGLLASLVRFSSHPQALGMLLGIQLVGAVVGGVASVVGVCIGASISAGVMHIILVVLGGVTRGYETTLKVSCYTTGSMAAYGMLGAVASLASVAHPALAGILLIIVGVAALVNSVMMYPIAIAKAHGIPVWKGVVAMIMYYVLIALVVFGLFLLFAAAFMKILHDRAGANFSFS